MSQSTKTCNYCGETPAFPCTKNGKGSDDLCLACYQKQKNTWKDYKVQVTFSEWVYDDDPKSAIDFLRDNAGLRDNKTAQFEVTETRPINWSSPLDDLLVQLVTVVKSGDIAAAREIAKKL
jgi:hypothetical protein